MSNLPFLSNLSRPVLMALSGAIALVVVAGLLFAAVPRGSDETEAESKTTVTIEATEIEAADTATEGATSDTTAEISTPDEVVAGDATPAGATPASATLTAATPSALIGGGWGSGPAGDAGGMRAYPGPGPQGDAVEVAWKADIPEGYEAGEAVVYGNRLLVTATSEAFGSNLTVYELASGQFLWSYAENNGFSSPFVATGRVFVTAGDSLVALSLETGDVLWTQQIDAGASQQETNEEEPPAGLSNPIADGNAVIVTAGSSVIALDAESGSELWRHAFAGANVYLPRLLGDIVMVVSMTTGTGDTASGSARYHGLSLETGSEIWRQDAVMPMTPSASADAGVVLVNDYRGGSLAPRMFDARTGQPVSIAAPCAESLPLAVGDTVACGGVDALTGEPLPGAGAWPGESEVRASTGEVAYLTSGTRLIAVDLSSGETLWSLDLAEVELDDGATLGGPGAVSVGDDGLAVEVNLTVAGSDEETRAIWIIGAADEPAATPVAGGTPAASPVAVATPGGGR